LEVWPAGWQSDCMKRIRITATNDAGSRFDIFEHSGGRRTGQQIRVHPFPAHRFCRRTQVYIAQCIGILPEARPCFCL